MVGWMRGCGCCGTSYLECAFANLARSDLRWEHLVSVVKSVPGSIGQGTSKKQALDFIRKPHDAYVNAKRDIEATASRSAARKLCRTASKNTNGTPKGPVLV